MILRSLSILAGLLLIAVFGVNHDISQAMGFSDSGNDANHTGLQKSDSQQSSSWNSEDNADDDCSDCSTGIALEGNYNQWNNLVVDLNDSHTSSFGSTSIDDNGNFIISGSQEYFYFANGTLSTETSASQPDIHTDTITHKYYVLNNQQIPTLIEVYSNAKSIYNMTIDDTKFFSTPNVSFSISPNGKYIILAGQDKCNCGARVQIWEGSLSSKGVTGNDDNDYDDDSSQHH
ncbi:MAG: hypothetical protein KGI33_05555 [Thaumarchaeota archaeon]|nr:hypothetical protein [Nitrososphaerota archaeon]